MNDDAQDFKESEEYKEFWKPFFEEFEKLAEEHQLAILDEIELAEKEDREPDRTKIWAHMLAVEIPRI